MNGDFNIDFNQDIYSPFYNSGDSVLEAGSLAGIMNDEAWSKYADAEGIGSKWVPDVAIPSPVNPDAWNKWIETPKVIMANQAGAEQSPFKSIGEILGQVLKTGVSTAGQVIAQKYAPSKYTYPNQVGASKEIYMPAQIIRKTGLNTGILSSGGLTGSIAGIPFNWILISGGILFLILILKR